MTYESDRLYNEVIRRNLARYSSTVKVREILPHLPCLTLTDREDVEAKRDTAGNYTAVQLLMDNLRRRENWPNEFIEALRRCEHWNLADEISVAYDGIKGRTNKAAVAATPPTDSTAAATVTTVTIHTVPLTKTPLLTPPSANAPAVQVPAPAPVPQISENLHVEQVNAPAPVPSPEPASQAGIAPPAVVPSQTSTPTIVSPAKVTSTVQQNEVPSHIGATENKTPILDAQTSTSLTDANSLSTLSAQASSSNTIQNQTTNSCSTSEMSEKNQLALPVKETTENLPVQESNPPLNMKRFPQPEECSDPTANEIVERTNIVAVSQSTSTAQATPGVGPFSISQEYFSKPGVLHVPQEVVNQEEPCSTVLSDLQISRTPEPSAEHPDESPSSTNESSSALLSHNLPEEDHYESLCASHTETLSNVIHFAEQPSVENWNGQPHSMMGNTANPSGASANLQHNKENQPVLNCENTENVVYHCPIRPSDHERATSINYQDPESNVTTLTSNVKLQQREESEGIGQTNQLHLAAAAAAVGVGLFLVWKMKHS